MHEIVIKAKKELENMKNIPNGGHLKTGEIRKLSTRLFGIIKDKSKDYVFTVCDDLLEQRNWPMGVIAFDFAYRMKKQYDKNTFDIFENWLENQKLKNEKQGGRMTPLLNLKGGNYGNHRFTKQH
ncbi:hypothetical protein FACS1894147_12390 [Spirochaetia bacterium]|nr:hypothetical protein FACS1894147_12390 [Spirochaetia bacterium]